MKKTWVTLLIAVGCSIVILATTAFTSSANSLTANANILSTPLVNIGVDLNGTSNQTGDQGSDPLVSLQTYTGVISGVASDHLTLTLGDGSTVEVKLDPNTQTNVPSLGVNATVNGLLVDQQANVTVHTDASQSLIADDVQVNPATVNADVTLNPAFSLVTAYQPGVSITVRDGNGQLAMFQITGNTQVSPASADLQVGSYVSITPLRDMVCGPLTAGEIVVSDDSTSATSTATATPIPTGATNGTSGNSGSGSPQSSATDSGLLNLNVDASPTESSLISVDANLPQNPITFLLNLLTGNQ